MKGEFNLKRNRREGEWKFTKYLLYTIDLYSITSFINYLAVPMDYIILMNWGMKSYRPKSHN